MELAESTKLLDDLITTWENEVVEFKQAGNDYSTDDIGKYFSALTNEANLRGAESGWLVFGLNNKTRALVGTDFRPQEERLQSRKMQIAENAEPRITFRDIHELHHADDRKAEGQQDQLPANQTPPARNDCERRFRYRSQLAACREKLEARQRETPEIHANSGTYPDPGPEFPKRLQREWPRTA